MLNCYNFTSGNDVVHVVFVWRAVFNLFTELKISQIEVHISAIQLEISPIQLNISPNQLEISTNRPI